MKLLFLGLALLCIAGVSCQKDPPRVLITNDFAWSLLAWGFNNGGKDTTAGMKVVDLDIDFQNDQIQALRGAGHIVLCYFSAGTIEPFRPDCQGNKSVWESAAVGKMTNWDEEWLDIRKLSLLQQLMMPRFQRAVALGCHGIEPDNTDCYDNKDCWGKMGYSDGKNVIPFQLQYNQWFSNHAHSLGLAIALKNTIGLVAELGDSFDCAVNEQCQTYSECGAYDRFASSNKGVFQVEYTYSSSFCNNDGVSMKTKYCHGSNSDGICKSGAWTNCFSPANPLPPTRWTNGTDH